MISLVGEKLETYAAEHTSEEAELLRRLAAETHREMAAPQMLTGRLEGAFLRILVRAIGARHVVEVGTFTGYSALSMAAGLPEGGKLVTCEIDAKAEAIARRYFRESPHGHKIEIRMGPALETLSRLEGPFDFAFIDADKTNYPAYYERCLELLRPGGLIAVDNVLWSGRVLAPEDEDTRSIVRLNEIVRNDARVDKVLLTVRDGVMLVYKN